MTVYFLNLGADILKPADFISQNNFTVKEIAFYPLQCIKTIKDFYGAAIKVKGLIYHLFRWAADHEWL